VEQYFKKYLIIIISVLMISATILASINYDDWILMLGKIFVSLILSSIIIIIFEKRKEATHG